MVLWPLLFSGNENMEPYESQTIHVEYIMYLLQKRKKNIQCQMLDAYYPWFFLNILSDLAIGVVVAS